LPKSLSKLVFRQHWPLLLGLLVVLVGAGVFQGLSGTQMWHSQNSPEFRQMTIDHELHYQRASHQYIDGDGRRYASKKAFYRDYQQSLLQLYRQTPTKKTNSIRGMFGTGVNAYYFVIAMIAGIAMIWSTRRRYLNEFLQGVGYRRTQIYQQQTLLYGSTTALGVIIGSLANLAILAGSIPQRYFAYFKWSFWLRDLTNDVLMAVMLLLVAGLLRLTINNGVIVFAFLFAMYLDWWLPLAVYRQSGTHYGANFLSRNWVLGDSLVVLLGLAAWVVARWLSHRYSNEQRQQVILVAALRLPVILLLSLPVGLLVSQVINGLLSAEHGLISFAISWILGVVGLIAWIYRPKWSQRLWQMVAMLR